MELPDNIANETKLGLVVQSVLGLDNVGAEIKLLKDIKEKYKIPLSHAKKLVNQFKPKKKKLPSKRETEIRIADELIEEFDIITLEDTRQILVKRNNCYKLKEADFTERLNELINETKYPYKNTKFNVLEDIKDKTMFNRDEFCHDKWVINFRNGYYDIQTDCFYEDGDLKFFYEIPHEWDDKPHDCPKLISAFQDWVTDDNTFSINDFFEMLGLIMSMNTKFKKAFYFYGDTNSGKTTLQTVIESVVGEKNRTALTLQRISERFGTHGLQFKILNMCGELSDHVITETDQIKLLIGGDMYISAEPKGGNFYKFRNVTKFLFAGNKIPQVKDDSDNAFFERFILVSFPNTFEINPNWVDRIINDEEEIKGILYHSIKGYKRLMERGCFRKEITESSKATWNYWADSLTAFIDDYYKFEVGAWVHKDDFLADYNDYRRIRKEKPITMSLLTKKLKKLGVFADRVREEGTETQFVYKGITKKVTTI